jgi:hypothetical protein
MEWWVKMNRFYYPPSQYSSIPISHFLNMTRQTIVGDFALGMTIHTPFHRHLHPWLSRRFFALSDFTVTGLASYLP